MQTSSPTPLRQPARTLVPSSPAAHTHFRSGTYNRNKLRATSSSEGHRGGPINIGIKGLANWRREVKPLSAASAAGSGTTTSGKNGKSDSKSGSAAGFRSDARSTISGKRTRTSGLGMGMTGTPAKRVRKSSKTSIGQHSTPLRQSQRYINHDLNTNPDTDIGAKDEAQELDLLATPSSSLLRLSSASAKDLSSPSMSEPDVSPIIVCRTGHRSRRQDSYDSLFSPQIDDDEEDGIAESDAGDDTLFPAARDISVPLNDLSSAPSIRPYSDWVLEHRFSKPARSQENVIQVPIAHVSSEAQSYGATPTRTRLYDYSVPFNEQITTPAIRDWSVPLNDSTPINPNPSSNVTRSSKTPSRPSSKLAERQSTPYRLPEADRMPPSDSITDTDADEPDLFPLRSSEENPLHIRQAVVTNVGGDLEETEDTRWPLSPVLSISPYENEAIPPAVETSRQPHSRSVTPQNQIEAQPSIHSSANDPWLDLGSVGVLSPSLFQGQSNEDRTPALSRTGSTPRDMSKTELSSSGDMRWQSDPFGFQAMERCLKGKRPQPYRYSSQTSLPAGPPSPSPISFAATTPGLSNLASVTSTSSPDSLDIPITPDAGRRHMIGRWRGARVLKRMQGELSPREHDHRQSQQDRGDDMSEMTAEDRSITDRRRHKSTAPIVAEDVMEARQARIRHYEDLKLNYELHVEYVLW
ncbi:hypothetical protein IAU59_006655 [Kwoniella sp. CBS 9459]